MPTIFDLITAKAIATYWNERLAKTNMYLGKALFPAKKQLGLDLAWFVGASGVPITLRQSEFDTEAKLRDRIGWTRIDTEMPFFREQMLIGEKERQELNKLKAADQAMVQPILNKIYDDAGNLVLGSDAAAERMRMQLLATGKIGIIDSGVAIDYDYALPTSNKHTITSATAKWAALDTAKPIQDITDWQDEVEEKTGVRPTRAICTKKTFNYLVNNESIRKDMQPLAAASLIVTPKMVREYLLNKCDLEISVNTSSYKTSLKGEAQKYFLDDVFTLIPTGNLGNTHFGTTPEESDLMSGGSKAQVDIVNTGVAITTLRNEHPVNVQTIVSAIMLPSWEMRDQCFIATVNS